MRTMTNSPPSATKAAAWTHDFPTSASRRPTRTLGAAVDIYVPDRAQPIPTANAPNESGDGGGIEEPQAGSRATAGCSTTRLPGSSGTDSRRQGLEQRESDA